MYKVSIGDTRPGSSSYSLIEPATNNANEILVNTKTLDEIAHKIKGQFILKIDVDGFDFEVLQGAITLLSERRIRSLLIETSLKDLDRLIVFCRSFELHEDRFFNMSQPHSDSRRISTGRQKRNRVFSLIGDSQQNKTL